jgi:hypothetical protein
VGLSVHDPVLADNLEPTCAMPEMAGGVVFEGAAWAERGPATAMPGTTTLNASKAPIAPDQRVAGRQGLAKPLPKNARPQRLT